MSIFEGFFSTSPKELSEIELIQTYLFQLSIIGLSNIVRSNPAARLIRSDHYAYSISDPITSPPYQIQNISIFSNFTSSAKYLSYFEIIHFSIIEETFILSRFTQLSKIRFGLLPSSTPASSPTSSPILPRPLPDAHHRPRGQGHPLHHEVPIVHSLPCDAWGHMGGGGRSVGCTL